MSWSQVLVYCKVHVTTPIGLIYDGDCFGASGSTSIVVLVGVDNLAYGINLVVVERHL